MGISQELASVPASSIPTQEDARNAKSDVLLRKSDGYLLGECTWQNRSRAASRERTDF